MSETHIEDSEKFTKYENPPSLKKSLPKIEPDPTTLQEGRVTSFIFDNEFIDQLISPDQIEAMRRRISDYIKSSGLSDRTQAPLDSLQQGPESQSLEKTDFSKKNFRYNTNDTKDYPKHIPDDEH